MLELVEFGVVPWLGCLGNRLVLEERLAEVCLSGLLSFGGSHLLFLPSGSLGLGAGSWEVVLVLAGLEWGAA